MLSHQPLSISLSPTEESVLPTTKCSIRSASPVTIGNPCRASPSWSLVSTSCSIPTIFYVFFLIFLLLDLIRFILYFIRQNGYKALTFLRLLKRHKRNLHRYIFNTWFLSSLFESCCFLLYNVITFLVNLLLSFFTIFLNPFLICLICFYPKVTILRRFNTFLA